jgi:hypothetical protein
MNRIILLLVLGQLASQHILRAESADKQSDLITQKAELFGEKFVRDPVLALICFGRVSVSLVQLKDGSLPYPDKSSRLKNTPWTTDQWATLQTANLRSADQIAQYGSTLYLSFDKDYFAFTKARLTMSSSCFFVASPRTLDESKTNAVYLDPEVIWELARCGDQLIFEANSGDYHATQLLQVHKDSQTADVIDAWPQRFVFDKEATRHMPNGATVVVVTKEAFLKKLAQIVFLEERSFPVRLIEAAKGKIPAEQLQAMACSFSLQLVEAGQLADLDSALVILETANENSAELDQQLARRLTFAKAYAALMRRAIVSDIITGGNISDTATLREFRRRSEVDNAAIGGIDPSKILLDADEQQLVVLGARYLSFDPTTAQKIFDIVVDRNSDSIEQVSAMCESARCDLLLGNFEAAKAKIKEATAKLNARTDDYRKEMNDNGLASLLPDDERRDVVQMFFAVRPDLELARRKLESAKENLAWCEKEIQRPATAIRLGPGYGLPQ